MGLPGNLILPLIQTIVASLAIFTALSRVSDYWHHPSDVLAGSLLGVVTQYFNCVYLMRLFDSEAKRGSKSARQRRLSDATSNTTSLASSVGDLTTIDNSSQIN